MKYFLILLIAFVSCKESEKTETTKTIIKQEIVEPKVGFYNLFLEYKTKQELFNEFPLDTSKYFKTYVLQGGSKLIHRQFEDIKPSEILSEEELDKLNYHTVFENYQSDFIDMYEFNSIKKNSNKVEIIYFFTYPYLVDKDKVVIGLEIRHKLPAERQSQRISMVLIIFNKINNTWDLTGKENLLND